MPNKVVFIGVGSNINPQKNILKALKLLSEKVKIIESSTFYKTKAISIEKQPDYLNGVWKITADINAKELKFDILKNIENKLKRVISDNKYLPRTIDLDILLYDNETIKDENIIIPDPDIYKRPFIAYPLYELEIKLVIPDTGRSISSIIKNLNKNELIPDYEFTEKIKSLFNKL